MTHHRCDVMRICGFLWKDLTLKISLGRHSFRFVGECCHQNGHCGFNKYGPMRWLLHCHKQSQSRVRVVVNSQRPN